MKGGQPATCRPAATDSLLARFRRRRRRPADRLHGRSRGTTLGFPHGDELARARVATDLLRRRCFAHGCRSFCPKAWIAGLLTKPWQDSSCAVRTLFGLTRPGPEAVRVAAAEAGISADCFSAGVRSALRPPPTHPRTLPHCQVFGLEARAHDLRHLVVDRRLLLRISDGDDQREGLRLEVLIGVLMAGQQLQLQPPAQAILALFSHVAVVGPHGRPLAQFLDLVGSRRAGQGCDVRAAPVP